MNTNHSQVHVTLDTDEDEIDVMPKPKPKPTATATRPTTTASTGSVGPVLNQNPALAQNSVAKKTETRGRKKKGVVPVADTSAAAAMKLPPGRIPGPVPGTFFLNNASTPTPMPHATNGARMPVESDPLGSTFYGIGFRAVANKVNDKSSLGGPPKTQMKKEHSTQQPQNHPQPRRQVLSTPTFGVPGMLPLAQSTPTATPATVTSDITATPNLFGEYSIADLRELSSLRNSPAPGNNNNNLTERRKRNSTPMMSLQRPGVAMRPPPTPTPNAPAINGSGTANGNKSTAMNDSTLVNSAAPTPAPKAATKSAIAEDAIAPVKPAAHPLRNNLPYLPSPPKLTQPIKAKLGDVVDDSDNDSNVIPSRARPRGRPPLPPPKKSSRAVTRSRNATTAIVNDNHAQNRAASGSNTNSNNNTPPAEAAIAPNGSLVNGLGSKIRTNEKMIRRVTKHDSRLKKHKMSIRHWRAKLESWKIRSGSFMNELRSRLG